MANRLAIKPETNRLTIEETAIPTGAMKPAFNNQEEMQNYLPLEQQRQFSLYDRIKDDENFNQELLNALYYENEFGVEPFDPTIDTRKFTQFDPTKATPRERGFFSKISESWRRGEASLATDIAAYESVFLQHGDFEEVKRIREKQQLQELMEPIEGNFISELFYGSAKIAPGIKTGLWDGVDGPHY